MKTFRFLLAFKATASKVSVTVFAISSMLLSPSTFAGQEPGSSNENQSTKPIEIVADQFMSNNEEKYAEFVGNVHTRQGEFVITSEQLRIYYKAPPGSTHLRTNPQGAIEQIVASGNVKISSAEYTAEADLVEYDLESMVLVLKGENSTLKSGKNLITGSKITFNRKDGQVKVERSAENRVRALFYSEEKSSKEQQKTE